ncbi:Poly(ADP-ribose) glycohydrolase like protein [Argiope bruennichi]|uniref:poly(ADP-ribose) glycohydrolase n=1 Tax=Argiope bruennichi TaxID=94029 RepID=A0A8T0FBY7_ARGBR|nr:Poly(ADP-ribose) glycohydrolase like protein [Argiope bruennichi]
MLKGQKRLRQINIKESFALSKKPNIELTSDMDPILRNKMAAAAEKRLAARNSETSSNNSDLKLSSKISDGSGTSTNHVLETENVQVPDSQETCLPSSADLFPSSSENCPESPVVEQFSSQETIYSDKIDSPATPNSPEENCISEIDSDIEHDTEDEEMQLKFLNRTPNCNIPLPKLEPSGNHSIMFSPHIIPGRAPRPYPPSYRDLWDSNHVRMPCASQNKYPVEDLNGEKQIRSRWDLICTSLRRNILCSEDLEKAILQYNSQYRGKWNFNGLHTFFETCFTDDERSYFFEETLPKMINITLDLPNICTQPIPLLKRGKNHYLTMSQKQIGCLLLNAFFCTFPRRSYQSRNPKFRWNNEYATYPDINFYSGTVTFHRQSLQNLPNWGESKKGVRIAVIKDDGLIETDGHGMLQVDFANKFVGGGVLGEGCVQEEIRFLICPELIVSRLFVECLGPTEALTIRGVEQYNKYSGYSHGFKWEGNFEDKTPRDAWGRMYTQLVAIDATHFGNSADQFKLPSIERELNKAYCGFFEDASPVNLSAIASGNWGCGAFKGDPRLKFLIQLMAASHVGRDLLYFTFGNRQLKKELKKIYKFVAEKNLFVGDLWRILVDFCDTVNRTNDKDPKLYDFLCSIFTGKTPVENVDSVKKTIDPEITDSDKNAILKLIEAVGDDSNTDIEDNDPG